MSSGRRDLWLSALTPRHRGADVPSMHHEAIDELRWLRSEIEALIFTRTCGGPYSAADRAWYSELCKREAALLRTIEAA